MSWTSDWASLLKTHLQNAVLKQWQLSSVSENTRNHKVMRLLNIRPWLEVLCISGFSRTILCPNTSPPQREHIHSHHSCRERKTTLTPYLIWSLIFYRSDVHFQVWMKLSHLQLISKIGGRWSPWLFLDNANPIARASAQGAMLKERFVLQGANLSGYTPNFWFNLTVNLSCKFVPVIIHNHLQCCFNVWASKPLVRSS